MRFTGILTTLAIGTSGVFAEELTLQQAVASALGHNRIIANARIERLKLDEQRAGRTRRAAVAHVRFTFAVNM